MNTVVALLIGLAVLIPGFIVLAVLIHHKKYHEPASPNADVAFKEPVSFKFFNQIVLEGFRDDFYKHLYVVPNANNPETWQTNDFDDSESAINIIGLTHYRLRVSKISTGTYSDTGNTFSTIVQNPGGSIWVCYLSASATDPKEVNELPKSIEDFDNIPNNNGQLHTLIWIQTSPSINIRPVFTEPGAIWRMAKTVDHIFPYIAYTFMAELDPGNGSTPTLDDLFDSKGSLEFVQVNRTTPQIKV